jgi:hypothetical protein
MCGQPIEQVSHKDCTAAVEAIDLCQIDCGRTATIQLCFSVLDGTRGFDCMCEIKWAGQHDSRLV